MQAGSAQSELSSSTMLFFCLGGVHLIPLSKKENAHHTVPRLGHHTYVHLDLIYKKSGIRLSCLIACWHAPTMPWLINWISPHHGLLVTSPEERKVPRGSLGYKGAPGPFVYSSPHFDSTRSKGACIHYRFVHVEYLSLSNSCIDFEQGLVHELCFIPLEMGEKESRRAIWYFWYWLTCDTTTAACKIVSVLNHYRI